MIIEYYLPAQILTNEDFEKQFSEWSSDKIEEKIGIRERHVVAENETALDLAYEASLKALAHIDKNEVDFVLLCTQSPDYFLPTSACVLQDKLGLRTDIGALDFNLGCSGYIYGLAIAKSLIDGGMAHCVLLVTAETYSKHMLSSDKANRTIFGDGAAATILTRKDTELFSQFVLGTDGRGKNNLIVVNGGFRNKKVFPAVEYQDETGVNRSDNHLYMNGPEIFNFTIESIPPVFQQLLAKNNKMIEDIDYVIFHQANKYMLEYLRKKIKIPKEKFHNNMLMTGNTVSATIPIALKDCLDANLIKQGDKLLLLGFGVGYSWGGTIITIH